MPILLLLALACLFLALMRPKKEEEYQPPKWLSNKPSYLCLGCGERSDNYFTRCPACNKTAEDLEAKPPKPKEPDFPNTKFTCKYCTLKTIDEYYFCPRCGKDDKGLTEEENKAINKNFVIPDKEWD